MLGDRRVHDLFIDHAERVFLLDLIDDAIVSLLILIFERLVVQILILKVLDHVRRHITTAPPGEILGFLGTLLLLLLGKSDLLSYDFLLDFVLCSSADGANAHIGRR